MTEVVHERSGFADVQGGRLYYEVAGMGHPLVLIHGGLVDRRLWDDQFAALTDMYRVIRYDLRGFGESSSPTAPFSHLDDLAVLLNQLGAESAYLVGSSLGGSIAIDFTLTYPGRVDALIVIGAGIAGYQGSAETAQQWAEVATAFRAGEMERGVELTLRVLTDGPKRTPEQVDPRARERVRTMTAHTVSRPIPQVVPHESEPAAITRLGDIRVPTLIIVGDADVSDVLEQADLLEVHIAGAQKVVIPDVAHHLTLEKPDEVNRVMLEFLGSLSLNQHERTR